MLGIRFARLPYVQSDDVVTLRLSHFWDLPTLYKSFTPEVLFTMNQVVVQPFSSFWALWRWLITVFQVVYVVQIKRKERAQIVGFIGLSDIEIGRSIQLALAIFHPEDRRQGYGRQAVELLARALGNSEAFKTLRIEISSTNRPSLSFCTKLGFIIKEKSREKIFLEKKLHKRGGSLRSDYSDEVKRSYDAKKMR